MSTVKKAVVKTASPAKQKTVGEQFDALSFDDAMFVFSEIRGCMKKKLNDQLGSLEKNHITIKEFCNNNSI